MAHPNPAHHRYHAIEAYRSRPRAARRVAQLRDAGFRAYMVVFQRFVVVHISEGKRQDLGQLPKPRGAR
jgi:hypothetical protein